MSNKVKKNSLNFIELHFHFCMAYNVRALCRCGISIPSARNRCPAFDKDKCLEPMFGDAGQARTKAAMLLLMIATTSSRTCTKPTVVRRFSSRSTKEFIFKLLSQCLQTHNVSPHWQKERCHLYKSGNSLIMSQPNNFSIFCT